MLCWFIGIINDLTSSWALQVVLEKASLAIWCGSRMNQVEASGHVISRALARVGSDYWCTRDVAQTRSDS